MLSLFLAFVMLISYGQDIYKGKSNYYSDIVANVQEAGMIYRGASRHQGNVMFNFDGRYVRRGASRYDSDIVAIYVNGKLYQGKSTYASDVIATYSNSIWYEGNSQYKALFNYDRKYVRRGKSKYDSDIMFTTSSYVHAAVLAVLILF